MYRFDNESDIETRTFFGHNNGTPMKNPTSSGMLTVGKNILTTPCQKINRTVPYFEEQDKFGRADYNESINKFIAR